MKKRILNWKEFLLLESTFSDTDNPNISKEASKKINNAITKIISTSPFFRDMIYRLKFKENKNLTYKTMATDGISIHYDPNFVLSVSLDEVVFVIVHEIMHNVLNHFKRKMPDTELWNIAADYALNQLITDIGKRPDGALYPGCGFIENDDKFEGLSAEEIYQKIKEMGVNSPPPPPPPPPPPIDDTIRVGDVIKDKTNNQYGIVKSINEQTGEIEYDPIPRKDVRKYLKPQYIA